MHDSGSLVGIQSKTLLDIIRKSYVLIKLYERLIPQAPSNADKKKLKLMHAESMKALSESAALYQKLTDSPPKVIPEGIPGSENYLDGIETGILYNIYLSRQYVELMSTVVPEILSMVLRISSEKNTQAANLNFMYSAHLSGKEELIGV